jgi:hypothetical protein
MIIGHAKRLVKEWFGSDAEITGGRTYLWT